MGFRTFLMVKYPEKLCSNMFIAALYGLSEISFNSCRVYESRFILISLFSIDYSLKLEGDTYGT
jgi:hypothetical protein